MDAILTGRTVLGWDREEALVFLGVAVVSDVVSVWVYGGYTR